MMYLRQRRGLVTLMTLILCILLLPAAAAAQDGPTPKLFLLPTQGVRDTVTSIVPERIGELSREQVAKDNRVDLMPALEELRKQFGGSTAAVAEAEALYTSGIGLLTAGEDKKAADSFQRALDMMEQNLGDLKNYDILADTLSNLALANHNAGFDLDARKRMQAFAHMRPAATLDAEKYPRELIGIFTEESQKVKKAGAGTLEISASTKDAKVMIDGIDRGKAPLKVRDVGFGYHYMVVRSASGSIWAEKIRVRGKKKVQKFKAELADGGGTGATSAGGIPAFYTELLSEIKSGAFGLDTAPYLKELCAQTGAAHVAFIVMFKERGKYVAAPFSYRASDGMLVRGDDVDFNLELSNLLVGVSALSDSLVKLSFEMPEDRAVTNDVELGGPPPAVATTTTTETGTTTESAYATGQPIQPPPKVKPSHSRNTWRYVGFAAGGLAVVGLVAGGIFLLSDGGNPSSSAGFKTEVSW